MRVEHRDDLTDLRTAEGLDAIEIFSDRLAEDGLLPHALRYALFALRVGGTLTIQVRAAPRVELRPFDFSFNQTSMIAARYLSRDASCESVNAAEGTICYRRTMPACEPGWSAGVIFSGNESECRQLNRCLDALEKQPELASPTGEIVVCGPAGAEAMIQREGIRYVAFEMPSDRFLIGAKKNALMRAMRFSKMLILHARIELEPGALGKMPAEFDLITPQVFVEYRGKRFPYLDLHIVREFDTAKLWRRPMLSPSYDRRHYLKHLSDGWGAIDGGCFAIRKPVFESLPMHDSIAWGESEDIEWSMNFHLKGYLVDLCSDAHALSGTSKMKRPPLPMFDRWLRAVVDRVRWAKAFLLWHFRRLLGV